MVTMSDNEQLQSDYTKDEVLLEEISTTAGGLHRGVDPREKAVLDEEESRLKKLALQALIVAKRRKKVD